MTSSWASRSAGRCGAPLGWAGPAFRIVGVHITAVICSVDQPLLSAPPRAPSCSVEVGTLFAFEIDEVTGGFARGVVARGTAGRLPDGQDERVEPTPGIASPPRCDVVAVIDKTVSGRKVPAREPKHWRAPSLVESSPRAR